MRVFRLAGPLLLVLVACVLLAGCASSGKQRSALESAQHAWSAAIRWNDFEGAWNLVDPDYRQAHPVSGLDLARYAQVQVTGYRELAARGGAESAMREIQIAVINRHTMAERTVRYTEAWRWDAAAGTWWVTGGLPDFWSGQ